MDRNVVFSPDWCTKMAKPLLTQSGKPLLDKAGGDLPSRACGWRIFKKLPITSPDPWLGWARDRGGLKTDQFNHSTLESKLQPGLLSQEKFLMWTALRRLQSQWA